jgi:hypothetical protein
MGITVGSSGARVSAGIPGAGFYACQHLHSKRRGRTTASQSAPAPLAVASASSNVQVASFVWGALAARAAIIGFAAGSIVAG